MTDIKIAFFDIDGTMLPFGARQLPERMVETLNRLQANGIRICVATGRSATELPKFEGVDFDAYMTFNGSLCYDKTGDIFSNPLPQEALKKVIANATAIGRPVGIATRTRLAANGVDRDLADYYAIAHLKLEAAEDFDEVAQQQVYQLLVGSRPQEYPALLQNVQGAKIAAWWDRAVDVIPVSAGKGVGVMKVLEHYGLTPEQAMAFGDGNNDLEMLQTVGWGVAMGNASEELKAAATDVCGNVDEDGIYKYCLEKGLI